MFEWNILFSIAEALALSVSILGVVGLAWHIGLSILEKLKKWE